MKGGSDVTNQQTEVALRKVHHSRVEVGTLVKCRENDATRQGSRHLEQPYVSVMSSIYREVV